MFDVKDLAVALGGVAILADHQIEVRLQTTWDVQHDTSDLKLPIVFSGTMDSIRKYMNTNGFKQRQDHQSLFGGYYVDDHGNSYIFT